MSKTIPHKAGADEVFPSPTVFASKAIATKSKDTVTCDECAALMQELTTVAFAEVLNVEDITHILGRLTGNHYPPEEIRQCILSRIAFQAALNQSACVETGNLFNGWNRIVQHDDAKTINISSEDIRSAISEGELCRRTYAAEVSKELTGTTRVLSNERFKKKLKEKIFSKYFLE